MKKILVPCDGSDSALRAVGCAARMAIGSKEPIHITLLHVLDPITFRSPAAALTPDELMLLRPAQAEQALRRGRALLEEAGVPFQECCRVGQPASEIAAVLHENRYDGVVMGTRGLGSFARIMIGSVAGQVVTLADVPVTLVKSADTAARPVSQSVHPGGAMKRILVPSDGSQNALRAVEYAIAAATESKTPVEVTLLHVVDPVTFTSLASTLSSDPLRREHPAAVEAALRPAERLLQAAGVSYDVRWRVGEPAPEIAAELKERPHDGIVMGTRGVGPIANLVLGSVANRVQYLVDIPLTMVK
jgi:nucleotide-binding universal stress UspA family protein